MYRAKKMSRRSSRRTFKKYSGTHKKNAVRHVMRGGVRM